MFDLAAQEIFHQSAQQLGRTGQEQIDQEITVESGLTPPKQGGITAVAAGGSAVVRSAGPGRRRDAVTELGRVAQSSRPRAGSRKARRRRPNRECRCSLRLTWIVNSIRCAPVLPARAGCRRSGPYRRPLRLRRRRRRPRWWRGCCRGTARSGQPGQDRWFFQAQGGSSQAALTTANAVRAALQGGAHAHGKGSHAFAIVERREQPCQFQADVVREDRFVGNLDPTRQNHRAHGPVFRLNLDAIKRRKIQGDEIGEEACNGWRAVKAGGIHAGFPQTGEAGEQLHPARAQAKGGLDSQSGRIS